LTFYREPEFLNIHSELASDVRGGGIVRLWWLLGGKEGEKVAT
jgi:hypothetical protein